MNSSCTGLVCLARGAGNENPRLLSGGMHLVGGCHQNPWATSVIQHGHLQSGHPTSPSRLRTVPLPVICLFCRLGMAQGTFSGTLRPWGWLTCIVVTASPLVGLTSRWIDGLDRPHWVVLRLQGVADSSSYQLCMNAVLCFLLLVSLFVLILVSIIKYPKGHI